jgi:hypothetical protein
MIYLVLGIASLVFLGVFLVWWHGICEEGEKADEAYRKYVDEKAFKESLRKKTQETLYPKHKRREK